MKADEFNKQLRTLCSTAMQENEMDVFQIIGSLMAATFAVDRTAIQMSQHQHAKEMATKIQPAFKMPSILK